MEVRIVEGIYTPYICRDDIQQNEQSKVVFPFNGRGLPCSYCDRWDKTGQVEAMQTHPAVGNCGKLKPSRLNTLESISPCAQVYLGTVNGCQGQGPT